MLLFTAKTGVILTTLRGRGCTLYECSYTYKISKYKINTLNVLKWINSKLYITTKPNGRTPGCTTGKPRGKGDSKVKLWNSLFECIR